MKPGLALALAFVLGGASFAAKDGNSNGAIYFLSFHKTTQLEDQRSEINIDQYLKDLKPLLKDRDIEIAFYDVSHKSKKVSNSLRNHVYSKFDMVGIGRAPNIKELREFINVEKKRHRPSSAVSRLGDTFMLVGQDVLFRDSDLDLEKVDKYRLRLSWLKYQNSATESVFEKQIQDEINRGFQNALDRFIDETAKQRKYYRVGFGGRISNPVAINKTRALLVVPNSTNIRHKHLNKLIPDRLDIHSFGNAKGYLRDSKIRRIERVRSKLIADQVEYWLVRKK